MGMRPSQWVMEREPHLSEPDLDIVQMKVCYGPFGDFLGCRQGNANLVPIDFDRHMLVAESVADPRCEVEQRHWFKFFCQPQDHDALRTAINDNDPASIIRKNGSMAQVGAAGDINPNVRSGVS